ncbi:unnamed protein product [Brassica oleracea var. botrytis]
MLVGLRSVLLSIGTSSKKRDPLDLALSREVNGFHGFIQSTSDD